MKLSILAVLCACGGSAPAPAAPEHATTAATAPVELAVDVFRWNCRIRDASGVEAELDELDPLHLPVGRPIHMKVTNIDSFEDLDIEAPGTSGHYAKRGGTGELTFMLDRAATYRWKCPVQEPPDTPSSVSDVPTPPAHSIIASPSEEWAAYTRAWDDSHDMRKPENLLALGKKLYEHKGCNACHTVDGTRRVGPTWAHAWGTQVKGTDGSSRTVDDAFVRESILTPQAFVADGFFPVMPSFDGQLTRVELDALVAYIRSFGATP